MIFGLLTVKVLFLEYIYNMSGWIKLHRSLLDWEWYKKSEYLHVFIHLILKANIQDKKWQNFDIKRGQLITSIDKICIETGVSNKIVRNALDKLISSNEIVKETTNKFTIITICKYDSYQEEGQTNGKQTGKQRATTKEYKNNINKLILEYNFETLEDKCEKNVKMFHSLFDSQTKTWNDAKFETWIKDYKKLENVLPNNLNAIVAIYTELAMQKMQYYPCKDFHFKTYKSLNGLTKIQKNEVYVYESILDVARENANKNQFWNDEFNKNIEKFKQWN
jgi:hypothetical protein